MLVNQWKAKKFWEEKEKMEIANPEDAEFYDGKLWEVNIGEGPYSPIYAYADCEQDALDYVVDYAEEKGYEGYFLQNYEIDQLAEEGLIDEYPVAGNHCRYLASPIIYIKRVK